MQILDISIENHIEEDLNHAHPGVFMFTHASFIDTLAIGKTIF